MHTKPVALVTGANQGIGLQIVKDLAKKGFTVLLGSRDPGRGEKAAKEAGGDVRAIVLDVTHINSITAAAERIRKELGRLDVLVNNAGISHARASLSSMEEFARLDRPSSARLEDFHTVFATNFFGAVAVTQAMLPLLREAPRARIVNVSSSLGSLGLTSDPKNPMSKTTGVYSASKVALNGFTVALANELAGTSIKVNAVCPGYISTNLNNYEGHGTVEDGAKHPVRMADLDNEAHGTFSNSAGPLPW